MQPTKSLLALSFIIMSFTAAHAQLSTKQDEKTQLYGLADADDKYVVKPIYKEIDFNFGSTTGLSRVQTANDKYGFINPEGKQVVPCKYDRLSEFTNGYATAEIKVTNLESKYGLFDSTGKEVVPVKYGHLEYYPDDMVLVAGETNASAVGLIGVTGKIIIPFQYEFWSKKISKGLWPVAKNNICGVVNFKNETVVPFQYDMIESYSDELGVAPARKDKGGKFGFIDRSGKLVVPYTYDDAWPSGKYLAVKKDGKWGVIDATNKIILPFDYAMINSIGTTTAWVKKTDNEDDYEIDLATKLKVKK